MNEQIQEILNDLYVHDPSLRNKEQELREIITQLIVHRPASVLDADFAAQLRSRLLSSVYSNNEKQVKSNINFNFMNKMFWSLTVTAVCAIVIVGGLLQFLSMQTKNQAATNGQPKIVATADHAFGKLDQVSQVDTNAKGTGNNAPTASNTMLAADATGTNVPTREAAGMGGGSDTSAMPSEPMDYSPVRYLYKGEPLSLADSQREVLKRVTGQSAFPDLSSLMGSLNFGLINFGSFSNMHLQNASFSQGPDGYNITVDVDNSMISIGGNYSIMPMMDCARSSVQPLEKIAPCGYNPLSIDQVPADSELVSIASQFVAEHSISTQSYGAPEVMNDWRIAYNEAPDKANYYVPDQLAVVYPLIINGQNIYDEGGAKTGLQVSVDLRSKKVTGVWNLAVQTYQSSMYEAETSVDRVLEIAQRGGLYGYVPTDADKYIDVELGTPEIQFVKMWSYDQTQSSELLIPSLVFPVISHPVGVYVQRTVVVPLTKDILNKYNNMLMVTPSAMPKDLPATATEPQQ